MMISLRTVESIEISAFSDNMLSTVTLPAGYGHHLFIVCSTPLIILSLLLISSIRISSLGDNAFAYNKLTSVTFLG